VWDVLHDRFTADERFARTFALSPDDLRTGLPIERVKTSIHPDDIDRVNALIAEAMRLGGPYRAEYRVQDTGGGWRWIEANGRVELDAAGRAVRFPGVLVDIERRREAEETVRRSEARFRALAQALPNQVWTADETGALDWINDRVGEYAGRPMGELLGLGWTTLVHPDDAERVTRTWQGSLHSGQPYDTEFRIRRHDGAWRWHLVRAIPVDGDVPGGRPRWVGTNTDIHDHKSVQASLADLNEALEQRVQERTRDLRDTQARLNQSQKMEALGQLTGGIAHDFNNLLQGITGSVEVMRRYARTGRDIERYADSALRSARRAAGLIHRLLAFARRQALDPKAVHVDRLVVSMEDLLRRTLGENIALNIDIAPGTWVARCDENQLESAILNLAINARDAMPRGGRLSIVTGNVTLDADTGDENDAIPAGQYATVAVADTGIGMNEALLARAFEPFFTTKPVGQGTGLGLSMIYGFARQSGGGARLASRPGEGTTATLFLPRMSPDAAGQGADAEDHAPRGGGEVVLVVEDDESVRLLIIDLLRELGYRTLESADGNAALRILQDPGRVDLLVSDVGLPGMNGRQLAEQARSLRPGLPVLLMSGYAPKPSDDELAPGIEVLAKPFPMSVLAVKVQEIMERR
jgi:PAS domain S-box-containing protein